MKKKLIRINNMLITRCKSVFMWFTDEARCVLNFRYV